MVSFCFSHDKMVIKVAKVTNDAILALSNMGPSYMSRNSEIGKAECLVFFPPGYVVGSETGEPEPVPEEDKPKKKKKKRKHRHAADEVDNVVENGGVENGATEQEESEVGDENDDGDDDDDDEDEDKIEEAEAAEN